MRMHRVVEVRMEITVLNLNILNRCGGSAFFVFYIKPLEAAAAAENGSDFA